MATAISLARAVTVVPSPEATLAVVQLTPVPSPALTPTVSLPAPSPTALATRAPEPAPTVTPAPTIVPTPSPAPAAPDPATSEQRQLSSRGGAARAAHTVVLDPGHGGKETGAVRTLPDGRLLREKDLNLKVGLAAAELLRAAGQRVVLTRTTDAAVNAAGRDLTGNGAVNVVDDLQARVDVANREDADIFVSIHFNAGNSASRGTEVFYNANHPLAAKSRQLATSVYESLVGAIKANGYDVVGRGVKRDAQATGGAPFYILGPSGGTTRAAQMPATLGEGLFLSYPAEAELLTRDSFLQEIARAYAEGILDYLAGS